MKDLKKYRILPLIFLLSLMQLVFEEGIRDRFWFAWALTITGLAIYLCISGIVLIIKLIKRRHSKVIELVPVKESVWPVAFFLFLWMLQMSILNFSIYLFRLAGVVVFLAIFIAFAIRHKKLRKPSLVNYNALILIILLTPFLYHQDDYTTIFAFFGLIAYIIFNAVHSISNSVKRKQAGKQALLFVSLIFCVIYCMIKPAIFVGVYFGIKAIFRFDIPWLTTLIVWLAVIAGVIAVLEEQRGNLGLESIWVLVKKIFSRIGRDLKSFFRGVTFVKLVACIFMVFTISGLVLQTELFSSFYKSGISLFSASTSLFEVNNENFIIANQLAANDDFAGAETYYLKAKDELSEQDAKLEVARIENSLGVLYLNTERFEESYLSLNSAHSTFHKLLKADNINTKTAKYNLGIYFLKYGDYDNALKTFGELQNSNVTLASRILYTNVCLNILTEMGAFINAKAYYENMSVFYEYYDSKSGAYMRLLNDQGILHLDLGEYDEAIELLNKAIEIHSSYSENEDDELALAYSNLASAYSNIDDWERVAEYNEKALSIYSKIYGEKSLNVADAYRAIGDTYSVLLQPEKQYEYYSKALKIAMDVVGEKHDSTALCYSSLSNYYSNCGNHLKAIECAEKAIEIRKNILAGKTSSAASAYLTLSQRYQDAGMYEKAIETALEGGNIYAKIFGNESVHVARACLQLARLYILTEDNEKALNYAQKGVAFIEKSINMDCSIKALAYQTLGLVFTKTDHFPDAEKYLEKAADVHIASYGENHTTVSVTLGYLGDLYLEMGNYEKAITYYNQSLEIEKIVVPDKIGYMEGRYHSIGFAQYKMKNYDDSLASYTLSLKLREKQIAESEKHSELDLTSQYKGLASTLNNIAAVYEDTEKYPQSAEYELRAYRLLTGHGIVVGEDEKIMERLHRLHGKLAPEVSFEEWLVAG